MTTVAALLKAAFDAARAPGPGALACLGVDVPRELVEAAGLDAWRLPIAPDATSTSFPGLGPRSRTALATIGAEDFAPAGLAIAHDLAEDAQLFAILRELHRTDRGPGIPFAFIDVLHQAGAATLDYNLSRLRAFGKWLETVAGQPVAPSALGAAILAENARKRRLSALFEARTASPPRLPGADAIDLLRAVQQLPSRSADDLIEAVGAALEAQPALTGRRVLLTGSRHETSAVYRAIEAAGAVVVGEDHAWGDPWVAALLDETIDPLEALALRAQSEDWPGPVQSPATRALGLARRARALDIGAVIHCSIAGDEAAPWDIKATRSALTDQATPFLTITATDRGLDPDTIRALSAFLETGAAPTPTEKAPSRPASASGARKPEAQGVRRSRKSLSCTADFGAWQKEWFDAVRLQAADGPFAVVNADAPQEILRALDIPYVVNQWWASIVAAKQKARDYGSLLKANDYPSHIESYSAQGLAAAFDDRTAEAPWGGLPRPTILALVANSDPGPKLYRNWSAETGAELFVFERSIDGRIDLPAAWWDDLPARWDQTLEPERLDLMERQIEDQIIRLERVTGRRLDRARLVEVMTLVNEQEEYYRRTRDLIARSRPAPVGIVDTMPATMVPQWHRGTVWARDAARRFFEEVAGRVEAGEAACVDERLRLMWVGRGLWSDTGFYQRWEESHGAVFVWSMYLGLAADGYVRDFEGEHDVVRALAARFVTMGDELRMPTWSGAWHVKEARLHGCHGAVAIDDADPLVLEALERAGIPVCRVALNNMGAGSAEADATITAFLEGLTSPSA